MLSTSPAVPVRTLLVAPQCCLPPKSVVYVGATANYKVLLPARLAATADGLTTEYVTIPGGLLTGTCAALISGHDRSLVTKLSAAEKLTVEHVAEGEDLELGRGRQGLLRRGLLPYCHPQGIL